MANTIGPLPLPLNRFNIQLMAHCGMCGVLGWSLGDLSGKQIPHLQESFRLISSGAARDLLCALPRDGLRRPPALTRYGLVCCFFPSGEGALALGCYLDSISKLVPRVKAAF